MELDILDETNEQVDRRLGKRPIFLTTLCILTWVGSGLAVLFGLFRLWSYAAITKVSEQFAQGSGMPSSVRSQFSYLYWESITHLLGAVFCAVGAVFMFRLRTFGFFIYLVGQLAPLAVNIVYSFSSKNMMGQELAIIWTGITFIFPVGFIVMYGVNLKHMR